VVAPGELPVQEDTEVADLGGVSDMLEAPDRVSVVDAYGVAPDEVRVAGSTGEGDEFSVVRVHGEAIAIEPGESLF